MDETPRPTPQMESTVRPSARWRFACILVAILAAPSHAQQPHDPTDPPPDSPPAARPSRQPAPGSTDSDPAASNQTPSDQTPASRPAASAPRRNARDLSAAYEPRQKQHPRVRKLDVTLEDTERDKELPLLVRFPNPPPNAPIPAIIFSHGAGGSSDAFSDLSARWARAGYAVIHPTHDDSLQLRRRQGRDLSAIRRDPNQLRRDVDPRGRHADVVLILDQLDEIEHRTGLRFDRDRIGMAGHSAGALTTQTILGAKVRGMRAGGLLQPRSVGDPRIRAGIVISGQGLTNRMFTEESWSEIDKPMLVIAGSEDYSRISNETPASRRHPFELAAPGRKHLIFIEGATHGSYAGRGTARLLGENPRADLRMITSVVESGTLAFWDAYLREDPRAGDYLRGESLVRFSGSSAEVLHK